MIVGAEDLEGHFLHVDFTDFSCFHKWLIVLNHHVCPEVALVCSLHKKEDVQDPEEAEH